LNWKCRWRFFQDELYFEPDLPLLSYYLFFFIAGCFLFTLLMGCFFGIGNQTPQAPQKIIIAIAQIIVFEERRGGVAAIELPP
jgi:hypothetical protein